MSNQPSKLIAHIPARGGSKRCPAKNARIMNGKPMIAYAIEAAQNSGIFDEIIVNSDSDLLLDIAREWGVTAFKRDATHATDTATGDDFTYDFLQNKPCDELVMINPVCPLIKAETIKSAYETFHQSDCDTLISCSATQMQAFCGNNPINIEVDTYLRPSQENEYVNILNWAVTIWDSTVFLKNYAAYKGGYLGSNRLLFPIDHLEATKVSEEEDFTVAESLVKSLTEQSSPRSYWTSKGSVGTPPTE